MKVSVIIPTFKRRDVVEQCVESLVAQTRPPDEIVFVDDTPDAEIRDLHAELQGRSEATFRFIENPTRASLTRSRNVGIDQTDSDVVVFFDSDSIVDEQFIEHGLETLDANPAAMAVRGIEDNRAPYPLPYQLYRWLFMQPIVGKKKTRIGFPPTFTQYGTDVEQIGPCDSMKGSNMMIRREVFTKARFDDQMERYSLLEDIDFALSLRAAWPDSIYCDPRMRIHHAADDEGRIGDEDLWMMLYVNKHYLAHKHFRVGPLRRLKLWWSDMGYVLVKSERKAKEFRRLWGQYRHVQRLMRKHRRSLEAGKLAPLNQYYTWMEGPDHGL